MWNTGNVEHRSMDLILDRDQRTTSHRVLDHDAEDSSWFAPLLGKLLKLQRHHDVNRSHRCAEMAITITTERNDHAERHSQSSSHVISVSNDDRGVQSRCNAPVNVIMWLSKWKWVLIWLGSLLLITILLAVQSAPMAGERRNAPPKWVNPCGPADEIENVDGSDVDTPPLTIDQILQKIVIQATVAKLHAETFRERYVKDIFKLNFDEWHSTWKHLHYKWLPEIPKNLGENINMKHLQNMTLDKALTNTFEYLQKFAVGLEQIAKDQKNYQLMFQEDFEQTEYKLQTVLCEIHYAITEHGITQRPDVSRDIMEDELRTINSATFRDLRDWMIFRDYMNGLEYVVQVFEYLRAHPQQTS